jgi:hypothetical protein
MFTAEGGRDEIREHHLASSVLKLTSSEWGSWGNRKATRSTAVQCRKPRGKVEKSRSTAALQECNTMDSGGWSVIQGEELFFKTKRTELK